MCHLILSLLQSVLFLTPNPYGKNNITDQITKHWTVNSITIVLDILISDRI